MNFSNTTFRLTLLLLIVKNVVCADPSESACTITGNSIDNVESVKSSCKNIIVENLIVPAGKTLDFTGISDVNIIFKGKTTFEHKLWKGPLILFSGSNVNITGAPNSIIDGNGTQWWDGHGDVVPKIKPRLFKLRYLVDVNVQNLYFLNSPRHCFAIHNCTNVNVSNVIINSKAGDTLGGRNTDGFNLKGSENVYINNVNVYNQDDCLAVRSGKNIHFSNGFCYHSHGLSIGSVGNRTNNIVEDVYITDSELVEADNGIRIKTVWNSTGLVTGVHFDNITMKDIKDFGIILQGNYRNVQGPSGTPSNGVLIRNLTISNIRGTVVENGTNICISLADGVASDWHWTNITITGGENKEKCSKITEGVHA